MNPSPHDRAERSVLVVSPHLDDAALSCGGALRRAARGGASVTVATVFSEDPPDGAELSALARRNHAAWGLGDTPFAARRAEDAAAAAVLGCDVTYVGFRDAIYRADESGRPLYSQVTSVEPHVLDRAELLPRLVAALHVLLDEAAHARVLCPAAVGGHVDHVLVRDAVADVCEPASVVYFEEFPYALRPGERVPVGDVGTLRSTVLTLTDDELDARVAAIACYRSQLRGLFPSASERAAEVLAARLGEIGRRALGTPNTVRSTRRMAESVRSAVAARGGERYWWRDVGQEPPLPAHA